jgi:hypothetical protein
MLFYTRSGSVSLSTVEFGISVFVVDCVVDDRLHDSTRSDDALDHQHDFHLDFFNLLRPRLSVRKHDKSRVHLLSLAQR